jgi:hypothetical protein
VEQEEMSTTTVKPTTLTKLDLSSSSGDIPAGPTSQSAAERPQPKLDTPSTKVQKRSASQKPPKPDQQLRDSLKEEIRTLFILDGLTRSEIKNRLTTNNKNIDKGTINEIIEETFSSLVDRSVADGNGNRYFLNDGQLFCSKGHGDKSRIKRLANFSLALIRPIVRDDGLEKHHSFEIEAKLSKRTVREELSSEDFHRMQWPLRVLGPAALVTPRTEPEAEYGLRVTAKHEPAKTIFTHTGWQKIDGKPYYLHTGGAIGVDGNRCDVKATLPGKLNNFSLPDPPTGEELKTAVRASIRLLQAAKDSVSFPLFAAVYRAPLGDAALSVYSSGSTGLRKTAVNLVAQQHYGKDFDEKAILHWDSTSNFLKEDLFIAKDAILLVDDFVPTGGIRDIRKAHTTADEVMRSVGNQSGRGRLGKDGRPQIPHEPRSLMLSTGETRPGGHSLAARTVHLSFDKGSVDNKYLTQCQVDAKEGLCALAMAGYLQHVAQRYDSLQAGLKNRADELRDVLAPEGGLLRSAANLANLAVGFEIFLGFATDAGAITNAEADQLWVRFWNTLSKLAREQDHLQKIEDPARDVLRRLNSASLNGNIYLEDLDPGETTPQPPGTLRVGWKESSDDGDGEDWYCEPEALYTAIVQLFHDQGSVVPWSKEILWQRLSEQGYTRGKGERKQYYRTSIKGKQQRLICIPAETFRRIDTEAERTDEAGLNIPPRRLW